MSSNQSVGPLTCSEVLGMLSAYLDGELAEDELAAVRAHVSTCDNCARFGGRFQRAVSELRSLQTDGARELPTHREDFWETLSRALEVPSEKLP